MASRHLTPPNDLTLQLVIDSIRDYAIFRLDPEGRIASWNIGAQLIKGYTADEIIGKTFATFYAPEDVADGRPFRLLDHARKHGRVEDEGWRMRKDGTRFWADVTISAIRDPNGEVLGFAKVTRDLTERRAQEEARILEAARFRAIVDSTRDYAIFMLDPHGNVATWNTGAERAKGYRADEILGKHFSIFYPNELVARGYCERELEVALQDGRFEDEGLRVRKDGSQFWANVVITPLYDREGRHMGFSKITRDLTERRKWEADRLQLLQANEAVRLRDEFLSIASHELRTPLMALQLQLDLALELSKGNQKVESKLDRASRNATRLSELITALLDVGRLSAGKMTLAPVSTDLDAMLREVVDRLSEAATQARCELNVSIEPGIVGIWDPMRIGQVVSNLLANAFRYAPGTQIDVTAARTADHGVEIRVRDRGPGIAPEDRQRIFARFERASARNMGGLGLGLYVAHEIVTAHGGSIRVDGADGGGAEFIIELPLTARTVEAA